MIATVLAVTWWELLFLPLGASHDGRINARFGLHVRNFIDSGLAGSGYLASMAPFSTTPYAHHPPLLNVLHTVAGSLLGQGAWQLHLIGYVAGLTTVVVLLWLARELGVGAGASVAAMALVAATPMFWIYARLGLGVLPAVVLAVAWRRFMRAEGGRTWLLVVAAATALSSWMGAVLVLVLAGRGMWGRHRRVADLIRTSVVSGGMEMEWGGRSPDRRRVVLVMAAMGAAGAGAIALTLSWVTAVGAGAEFVGHLSERIRWPSPSGLVAQYRWFYGTLFPWWFRWLIVPALVGALFDLRTRVVSAVFVASLGLWTLVAPGAAYVHDYWTYPLLVPVFLGLAALTDRLGATLRDRRIVNGVLVALVVLAAVAFGRLAPYRDAYFRTPSAAGALLKEVTPPPGQVIAWVAEGVDELPRWVSYYWDLPVTEIRLEDARAVGESDLVLVRLDRLPPWMADIEVVTERGRYALVRGL